MNSIYGWFCAFHDQKFAWQDAVRLCIKFLPRSSNPIMLLSHWLTFFGPKSSISLLQDLQMYLNFFGAWNWKSLWISSWTRPYFSMLICHIHWKKQKLSTVIDLCLKPGSSFYAPKVQEPQVLSTVPGSFLHPLSPSRRWRPQQCLK